MTCPKNPVSIGGEDGVDFEATNGEPSGFTPAEITPEETENIRKLIKEFGL